ncbi:MAG: CIA30 family protein [Bacteroidota bacterium]
MKALSLMLISFLLVSDGKTLRISFNDGKDIDSWTIINDGVMGGLSVGSISQTDNGVRFAGEVSLENNGGFTSYKSEFARYDLSKYKSMSIRYRSSGHDIGFQLENNQQFYLPYFKINLPVSSEWTTLKFDFEDFGQYRMGRKMGGSLNTDNLKDILRMGFITNEKKAGKFSFEVAYVQFDE